MLCRDIAFETEPDLVVVPQLYIVDALRGGSAIVKKIPEVVRLTTVIRRDGCVESPIDHIHQVTQRSAIILEQEGKLSFIGRIIDDSL